MQNVQHAGRLGKADLQAIVAGRKECDIDDMEFFETLAQRQCLVMPPWVYHVRANGKLEKLTPVQYTPDYRLDKPSILLALMDKLKRSTRAMSTGGRHVKV